jgi:two-component system copper resistance phosphate regulon response regulator CusR
MRILLVEDETDAAKVLAHGLREQTYSVDIAVDGEAALELAYLNTYDLIILDVMLPRMDGFEVCRELRMKGSMAPIMMLTARDAVEDRILGLDTGADDYLIKPFDFQELLARLRALRRRRPVLQAETITVADLKIETRARRVWRGKQAIKCTAKEYALLEYLASRADEVVSRADIAEHVWDKDFDPFSNLIEVYVQRLRRKIDQDHPVKLLHTRRSEGYMLTTEGEESDV